MVASTLYDLVMYGISQEARQVFPAVVRRGIPCEELAEDAPLHVVVDWLEERERYAEAEAMRQAMREPKPSEEDDW